MSVNKDDMNASGFRKVFFESDFKDLLELNLSKMNEINTRISWSGVHGLYGRIRRLMLKVFCSAVCQLISNKRNMEILMLSKFQCRFGQWLPSQEGWVKLNMDGASKTGVRSGCGGLIRGDQGEYGKT